MSIFSIASAYAKSYSDSLGVEIGYEGPFPVPEGDAFTFHYADNGAASLDSGLPMPIVLIDSSGHASEIPFTSSRWLEIAGEIPNEDEE